MKSTTLRTYKTGVLVPIFSLRSDSLAGGGEFLDLKDAADWCVETGLDVLQILPVQDSGDDSSPYNALSAYALHPNYIRIEVIPEFLSLPAGDRDEISLAMKVLGVPGESVTYTKRRHLKLQAIKRIYSKNSPQIKVDKSFLQWIEKNPWVKAYGVFMALKDAHNRAGWRFWRDDFKHGTETLITKLWTHADYMDQSYFYAWIQFRAEQQLLEASQYIAERKILFKGDVPILMNEDSVDVWSNPLNFTLVLRAGSPPDNSNERGQNWGYPLYNWDYLEAHDYQWWRERLLHAQRFFSAFRIDHVLGFFRIWTVPHQHFEGVLGYFKPSIFFTKSELEALGFDEGRIRWLCEPHMPGQRFYELFGMRAIEIMGRCFVRLGNEELYLFKPEIKGERDILDMPIMQDEKEQLLQMYRDRALLEIDNNLYCPAWNFRDCWRYHILSANEKVGFESLIEQRRLESEVLWQKQGEKILSMMTDTVDMLPCAEDLGAVPSCVPATLKKLGILGLKIPRWSRKYEVSGAPFIQPDDYEPLSICAASVHDSSTLREWWLSETEREAFWNSFGGEGPCPHEYNTATAKVLFQLLLKSRSMICMFQIQDFLGLEDTYRSLDPSKERLNVPGTVGDHNWSWRMPISIQGLRADKAFSKDIKNLLQLRKKRQIPIKGQ